LSCGIRSRSGCSSICPATVRAFSECLSTLRAKVSKAGKVPEGLPELQAVVAGVGVGEQLIGLAVEVVVGSGSSWPA